ncbi:TetR/AcrR family transcriptional regulator [Novosphingobium taihuense]|uniref:AcrR family transcriptional regulator n=1 Tax=Novosphingobium taihuense TaxID=260085 RepID=A0A7W7ETS5_9SPHN|nr:TetR/AcrR family transcriptional regulator [Novosphingobium taihuense]MBB4613547.1 AcrR family transcriptional regulator [Novosphingobium taihuense]TWH81209.1 TetR family transcriptional regulator [Novosphingobium taihuense]
MNQVDDTPKFVTDMIMPEREGGYLKGQETRELILRTALTILIEEGYRAMSMRRVATACGMKFGNLTYHYRSREDLVRELMEAVIRSYEVEFVDIVHMPGVPAEERLRRMCNLILDDIRSKKTTNFFPELWALSNHDAFVSERIQELYVRARAPLMEIIAEMRPDLDEKYREIVALFISGSMEGMTIFAGNGKPFEKRMPHIERIAAHSFVTLVKTITEDEIRGLARSEPDTPASA